MKNNTYLLVEEKENTFSIYEKTSGEFMGEIEKDVLKRNTNKSVMEMVEAHLMNEDKGT